MDTHLRAAITQWGQATDTIRLIALDFDGTLAPLVDDPHAARALPESIVAITDLAQAGAHLALVSGRNLTDLAERTNPPAGTTLIGSHGAEHGVMPTHGVPTTGLALTDQQAELLLKLVGALRAVVVDRPGAWVQVKPSAAVVHTRQAASDDAAAATDAAVRVAQDLGLKAMIGKSVVEIAVMHTSKGLALSELRAALERDGHECRIIFAGDDTTDETAFRVLRRSDIGIKVGEGLSVANYRVTSPHELAEVLTLAARTFQ